MTNIETVKGFRDFTGEEAEKREKIREILVRNFRLYGFEPTETPVVEDEEFVRGDNKGDDAISEIYRLSDKGKRNLALRYEFTFQLKRLMQDKKLPYRRYSIGPVFRDEPVSSARLRQITQCDMDIIGSTIRDEAEILKATQEILIVLGIKFIIKINSRRLINEILSKEGIREENIGDVIREIDKLDKLSEREVQENLKKYNAEKIIPIFKKGEKYFEKYEAYKDIKELQMYASLYGVETTFSPSLARGLSYYTGNVFEIKTKEMKESICGGGSYIFNGVQSTGLTLGLDRLSMLTQINSKKKEVIIIPFENEKEAISLSRFLRENNISCFIYNGKVLKAMNYANSKKIPYVIFLGEEEVKSRKYKIRNMDSGEEEQIPMSSLPSFFK
jgi:histidyl-tRNA synthetase